MKRPGTTVQGHAQIVTFTYELTRGTMVQPLYLPVLTLRHQTVGAAGHAYQPLVVGKGNGEGGALAAACCASTVELIS